jgi:chemotaxis protein methyltransferase CheR
MSTLEELIDRLNRNRATQRGGCRSDDNQRNLFLPRQDPFDHFRDTIMPTLIAARAREKRIRFGVRRPRPGRSLFVGDGDQSMGAAIAGYRIDIVATDLSSDVLEKAKAGIYSQFEVQRGLPVQLLVKFFDQVGETRRLAPELRSMVQFRPLNLLNDFSVLGNFDVVFCRNVLIYFDQRPRSPSSIGSPADARRRFLCSGPPRLSSASPRRSNRSPTNAAFMF